jgi:hypothetical protein
MIVTKVIPAFILAVCLWGVLNPKLKTRTIGTVALSLIALRAASTLCS